MIEAVAYGRLHFLSHLSGDEAIVQLTDTESQFLSHLSGDEVLD